MSDKYSANSVYLFLETLRFYKALSQIGTDFTLMSQAFGKFTRNELKVRTIVFFEILLFLIATLQVFFIYNIQENESGPDYYRHTKKFAE